MFSATQPLKMISETSSIKMKGVSAQQVVNISGEKEISSLRNQADMIALLMRLTQEPGSLHNADIRSTQINF
jgi:hypothetical protein